MLKRILVTGARGLIGTEVSRLLSSRHCHVTQVDRNFDLCHPGKVDTRNHELMHSLVQEVDGVIHLAAISRVVWGEQDPKQCWEVNVDATKNIVEAALESARRPWVVFASSREVYGQQQILPVVEDAPFGAMNVYAKSKVAGEEIIQEATQKGLVSSIVRFSNVFGSPYDHIDRVIPAFCRAALRNTPLRIDGFNHVFDFTYHKDVCEGVLEVVRQLENNSSSLPPIHFTTGRGLTLSEAATLICELANSNSSVEEGVPRSFDVAKFVGDNARAFELLRWRPKTSFEEGVKSLLNLLKKEIEFENSQSHSRLSSTL